MKQKVISNFKWLTLSIALGFVFGGSLAFVKAWTEPTVAPPGGNLGAPINTGSSNQTKTGGYIRAMDGSYGLLGDGTSYGVRGKDTNSGGRGYLGRGSYGVYSIGNGNRGIYSRDGDGSSWTHLNYANYGVYTNSSIRVKRVYSTDYWPSNNKELASKYYVDKKAGGNIRTVSCRWSPTRHYSQSHKTCRTYYGSRFVQVGTRFIKDHGYIRYSKLYCCRLKIY